jgi:hypothetical protein
MVAVPQLKRLVVAFPPRRPGFASEQYVGFVVDKAALGQVFSTYIGFPRQSFHQYLHHPFDGHSAEWTQWDSTLHYTN